ncbi:MAG: Dihydrofolate reductase [Elusimicrobia bacterium]|nr:Dihydrofolate reductase [Elusimicrobiota bacterium]
MTDDRVIGRDNQLPWHLSEDLVRFKKITSGHPIVMGRKTYESIGKPLPGRRNIVVTRSETMKIEGADTVHSLKEALQLAGEGETFVIGGATLFKEALPIADKLYMTLIHHDVPGDVHFPDFDLKKEFQVVEETHHQSAKGEKMNFSFITALRR